MLRFAPLGEAEMAATLREAMPEASETDLAGLIAAGGGAPGHAMRFAGLDVVGLDRAMDSLVRSGDPDNGERSALARALSGKPAQARYELFLERAPSRIAAEARNRRGPALAEAVALWEKARALAGGAVRLSLDPQTTVFELAGFLAALGTHKAPSAPR
jgi:DNA polymerase-3 subunit delta'